MSNENNHISRLSPSDESEVKQMILNAPNMETLVEDFRMRFGFVPALVSGDALPNDPEDRGLMVDKVMSQSESKWA